MCCTRLTGNAGPKKLPKIRHLGTITQLCWAIPLQLRHILKTGKKHVKQQYLPHMPLQYGELWPTSGWDRSLVWEPPANSTVLNLGSVTAWHSSSAPPIFGRAAITFGIDPHSSLWSPYVIGQTIYIFMLFLSSFFISSPNLSGQRLDVYHTSTHGVALVRI